MWRRRHRDRDLERELCAHLELEAAERREEGLGPVPYPAYELLRGRNTVFSSMLAYAGIKLAGQAGPVNGQLVSGSYFETLV